MLDTFRKRDNTRPAAPGQPVLRPGAPNPAHALGVLPGAAPNRSESVMSRPAVPESVILASSPQAAEPSAVAPPPAAKPEPAASAARLTVGPDIKLKGAEITDCDTLVVEGQVDASMDSRVVEIAESGVFRGKVHVDLADIRGRFEGELTVHRQLVVRETGLVSGTIRYGKIRVDEGGVLCGDVASTEPAAEPRSGIAVRIAEGGRS